MHIIQSIRCFVNLIFFYFSFHKIFPVLLGIKLLKTKCPLQFAYLLLGKYQLGV